MSGESFPRARLRRWRRSEPLRRLVAETRLGVDDLLWPVFVHDGKPAARAPAPSMPGVFRFGIDALRREAEEAARLGIRALAIFPVIDKAKKTPDGAEALNPNGLVARALAALKKLDLPLALMTDVALDPFTSHGHDCLIDESGAAQNDATIAVLARQACLQAAAGSDIVAPSDMMDGRVAAIRDALEGAGLPDTLIVSYAAKYASAFYGPFRSALGAAKLIGDKKTYQMDPANLREAAREWRLDLAEGADAVIVKPGMPYLDVAREAARDLLAPVFAYQVSGEYAMIKAAAARGFLDEQAAMLESLLAFKRAGCAGVLTYFAPAAARLLRDF